MNIFSFFSLLFAAALHPDIPLVYKASNNEQRTKNKASADTNLIQVRWSTTAYYVYEVLSSGNEKKFQGAGEKTTESILFAALLYSLEHETQAGRIVKKRDRSWCSDSTATKYINCSFRTKRYIHHTIQIQYKYNTNTKP